jgi:GntR family transcriptional regulator/MocR family aminotransferase
MSRGSPPYALELDLDRGGGRLAGRLSGAMVASIADGQLADGDAVPSTRVVAASLGVARSVVVEAYEELTAAGFFGSRAGSGTWVEAGAAQAARAGALASTGARAAQARASAVAPRLAPETGPGVAPEFDLRPGYPDGSLIDARDWGRAWRAAARASLGPAEAGPARAVADYLRQARGLAVEPEQLFFFPCTAAAIGVLAAAATPGPGATMAFEDPGYDIGARAFRGGGARLRPVPVDGEGLDVGRLRGSDWGVYVTPAHQFPTGSRMSVARRGALLDWAARTGGLIFEDDYDGEFRYDVAPMPPLMAMSRGGAAGRVIYLGTSSKILTRQLRVAWAVVPPSLHAAVRDRQVAGGAHVSAVSAGALAALIGSRAITRQITRTQRVYAARRACFAAACRARLPGVRLLGIDAGLHVLLALPGAVDDAALAAGLARRGLACAPLSRFRHDPAAGLADEAAGLVCGYANLPETRADEAVAVIRAALDELPAARP